MSPPKQNRITAIRKEDADTIVGRSPDPSGITLILKGSHRYSCSICHGDTWITDSAHQVIRRKRSMRVVCLKCLQEGRAKEKDGSPAVPHYPTREELEADVGKEAADKIIEAIESGFDPTKRD